MPKGTETTTKFKVDISDFKKAMQEANRAIRLANSEFKSASDGTKEWAKSTDGLTAKITQLNKVMDAEQRKLDVLENEYNQVAEAQGKDSKEAQELQIKINNQTATVKKTQAQLNSYEQELKDVKNPLSQFGKKTDENTQKTKKASDGFTVAKGALADLVANGVKLAITGLKNLTREISNAYKEFDEGRDKAIKATGATGESAKKLTKSYSNVAKSVKGSFSDIGSVLGEVQTRFEFTDDVLEEATKDFIKFADVTETDGKTAVQLVSRAMANAEIETSKYKEVLDYLTTTSQKSGASVDKLAENLTKYGAPLRQLGFDTKESIALLGAWEKSGVNAQSAFAGLRKSVVNWSKDGKNSREEFTKTLDEIKKAPNITKATQKAIEVFGTKAGPDLADAIRAGKFEYQDYINALDKSKGSLQATYKETQSGADKLSLAWQNAKTRMAEFASKIVEEYGPQIKQGIKTATDFIQQAFTWIITNGDKIIAILKGIAVAFVTYKAVSIITGVVSSIVSMVTALQTAKTTMAGLNAVMSANVIGAVIAVIAGLVVAVKALNDANDKAIQKEYGLSEAQKKNIETTKELKSAYDDMDSARKDSMQSITGEFDRLKELKNEYNSLVGSNGKIKKGYEERANFIINQLSQALGLEKQDIQDLIDKNGKLGKSIDKVIEKKKAQLFLEANESAYKKALKERKKALDTYAKGQQDLEEAQEKYNETMAKYGDVYKMYKEYEKDGNKIATFALKDNPITNDAIKKAEEAEKALEKEKKAVKDAENTYIGYNATITNYENLSTAIISGNAKQIQKEMQNIENSFISAKDGTANTLQQQQTDLKTNYENLKAELAKGTEGITQEQVNSAKKMLEKSKNELVNYFNNQDVVNQAKAQGVKIPQSLIDGIKSGEIGVDEAVARVSDAVKFGETAKKAGKDGTDVVKNLKNNILSGKEGLVSATEKLKKGVTNVTDTLPKDAIDTGANFDNALKKGLSSDTDGVKTAGKEVAQSAKKGADTKDKTTNSENSGKNFVKGYINGIQNLDLGSLLWKAAKSLAQKALAALQKGQEEGSPSKITTQSGKFFTQGYINGIGALIKNVSKTAKNVGTTATKSLQEAQEEHSPSKITYKSGVNFVKGFIHGMASEQKSLVKTTKNLVSSVIKELKNLDNYNFSTVASNATSLFSGEIADKINYFENKISYKNEQKIAKYDKQISDYEKKVEKLEKKRDKTEDKAEKKQIQKEINKYKKLISTTNKAKENYQKASSEALSHFNDAMSEYQSQAQKLIDDTINGISDKYQKQYDDLINKQNTLIDKLRNAKDLFSISGANVITITDIKEQTKQIKDYADKLQKIKKKVSADLFDKIASYDMEQGSAFIDQLLGMSKSELKAYSDAYDAMLSTSEQVAENLYKSDFEKIEKDYKKEIDKAFKNLPKQLEEIGKNVMKGFVYGLTNDTDYMSKGVKTFVKSIVGQIKKELKIKSPSRVTMELGEYTGEGFGEGLAKTINYVKQKASLLANSVAQPLDDFHASIGTVQGVTSTPMTSTSVVNNYNLVQNNTSPKSLSALETYRARRQQVAMVKAMTGGG